MSTIANGFGIRSVQRHQDARVAGEPAGMGYDRPYENPLLAQVATTTWSAAADVSDEIVEGQTIRTTITDPDGVAYVTNYVLTAADNTAGTDGAGLALMATLQAASIEANPELVNIVSASASAAVCTVSWLHYDPRGNWSYTSTVVAAAAETTLVTTEVEASQSMGGSVIPMARFVAEIAPVHGQGVRRARLPTGISDRIAGVALRDITQERLYDLTVTGSDSYPVGSMLGVRESGDVHMLNTGDAAAAIGDPVYTVISTTGGDALGEARSTRDGTADVWTITPSATNDAEYGIALHFPAWDGLDAVTLLPEPIIADGSATATEICDALRVSLAALGAAYTDLATSSGTTTLVITGDILGRPMVVTDAADPGEFTSITHTTTAAVYTALVPRARWVRPAAASAVGTINLSR